MSTTRNEILVIVAKLHTMSHVAGTDYEARGKGGAAATDDEPGGRRPSGGIDRKDDREPDFYLKSADYFTRRLARAHSEGALRSILSDAQKALEAWQRTPVAKEPEWGSFHWRRKIALEYERGVPLQDLRRIYSVSRATIFRYVKAYGTRDAA